MASKRSYWHPVGYLIEKFMAPYLDTCADIHLEDIKKLKKVNTQFKHINEIIKKNDLQHSDYLKKEQIAIEEHINIFEDCSEFQSDIIVLLDDIEKKLNNYRIEELDTKNKTEFKKRFEEIKGLKKEYENSEENKRIQIVKSLSPANLWYYLNTELLIIEDKKLVEQIKEFVNNEVFFNEKKLDEAYEIAQKTPINKYKANLFELLETAYYLRMMIAIASESYKNNDNSKDIVEKCDGLESWIADNIADSVLVVTKWEKQNIAIEKNGSLIVESIIDTGIIERYKYLNTKNNIYDPEIRFKHLKGTFIRWLANFYDKLYYTNSAFLGYPKVSRKEYQAFCFARVCPHCRHLIFDYDQRKYLCNKNARKKNQ